MCIYQYKKFLYWYRDSKFHINTLLVYRYISPILSTKTKTHTQHAHTHTHTHTHTHKHTNTHTHKHTHTNTHTHTHTPSYHTQLVQPACVAD